MKIALVNQKGGVGKTTTAVNMSACLAEMGKRVLLIDLDGQRNSTLWCLGMSTPDPDPDLLDVFLAEGDIRVLIKESLIPGLHIIPASEAMREAQGRMTNITQVLLLKRALSKCESEWDCIVMDCPLGMQTLTIAALVAATHAIIPSQPGGMDVTGITTVMGQIDRIKTDINPNLTLAGILLTRTKPRTYLTSAAAEMIRKAFPDLLYDTMIRESVRFGEVYSWSQSILDYESDKTGKIDYRAFTQEFLARDGGDK